MVHIKSITIRGFKSYKDEVSLSELSKKHNAIVGRNGTGKSNFFDAIRFVLCDDRYYNMSHAERQHLLYEGPGPNDILSAYVEIVFDNSDSRFPIDREEVTLRRSIGLKKDEYFLDKKHVTKQDVISLLESAGFSRANPYYIVQQGKVQSLSLMKDEQRLDLLKEVAGTKVYEQRRTESAKIMVETESKREKIVEVLKYIEERLAELEEEKTELEQYRTLEVERRAIEHTYYDKMYSDTTARLEECEAERIEELERASNVHDRAADTRERLAQLETQVQHAKAERDRALKAIKAIDEERIELRANVARLELAVDDSQANQKTLEKEKKQTASELREVQQIIKTTERKIKAVQPAVERHEKEEAELRLALASTEQRLTELYSKQGRSAQFKSKGARDKWLKEELSKLGKSKAQHEKQIEALEQDVQRLESKRSEADKRTAQRQRSVKERREALEKSAKKLGELQVQRDQLAGQRKELWREDSLTMAALNDCRTELVAAERQLQSAVSRATSTGLEAVRRIAMENRIGGVYGPLIELITTKPEFAAAVEVAARGSLFHVVVDTDDTAAKVLDIFNREKVNGRVSFLPLNRLKPKEVQYPQSPDVRPMVDEVRCEAVFRPAVKHVFGKVLVCRTLEVAAMNAKQHNLDCITLDGDEVERKGALTGGFNDPRSSWLASMDKVKQCRSQLGDLSKSHSKTEETLQGLDQRINELLGEIEKCDTEVVALRDGIEQLLNDLRMLARDQVATNEALESSRKALETVRVNVVPLEGHVKALEAELSEPLHSKLTSVESAELHKLQAQQTEQQHALTAAVTARADATRETTEMAALLESNLRRRELELRAKADRLSLPSDLGSVTSRRNELKANQEQLNKVDERWQELDDIASERSAQVKDLEAQIDKLHSGDSATTRALLDESKRVEKLQQQRSVLMRQRDDYARKIRELGSLPQAKLAAELAKLSQTKLLERLRKCNEQLRKYSHVNKKALDQYVNFTDQRDTLVRRQQELNQGADSIVELIDSLDRKKDEAIERTFKAVAKYFRVVFKELVPDGQASLIMQTRDPSSMDSSSQSHASGGSRISRYTGVGIKVSFAAGSETVHIQQLSGGQKSLVALALIFAIQRSDPAPFYLFDEIDSALDTTYRSAVANMIKAQSANTQFVTTTFKPELVTKAKRFYGISFTKQKISTVRDISRNDALRVIEEEAGQAGR